MTMSFHPIESDKMRRTDSTDSLSQPLLCTAIPMDTSDTAHHPVSRRNSKSLSNNDAFATNSTDLPSSTHEKALNSEPSQPVRRLASFVMGSFTGILVQLLSVLCFAELILYSRKSGHPLTIPSPEDRDAEPAIHFSDSTPWIRAAVWILYHFSLAVYLIIWVAMMVMAISKGGWQCMSGCLRINSTLSRRTCFLRLFFFINGFVQGSLLPWVVFEFATGSSTNDAYWMPISHIAAFILVVFVYDWMNDRHCEVSIQCHTYEHSEITSSVYHSYSHESDVDDIDDEDDANCLV